MWDKFTRSSLEHIDVCLFPTDGRCWVCACTLSEEQLPLYYEGTTRRELASHVTCRHPVPCCCRSNGYSARTYSHAVKGRLGMIMMIRSYHRCAPSHNTTSPTMSLTSMKSTRCRFQTRTDVFQWPRVSLSTHDVDGCPRATLLSSPLELYTTKQLHAAGTR